MQVFIGEKLNNVARVVITLDCIPYLIQFHVPNMTTNVCYIMYNELMTYNIY